MSRINSLSIRSVNIERYVNALVNAELHFVTLKNIEVVVGDNGKPLLYAGASSVIFKVKIDGLCYSLKCYDDVDGVLSKRLVELNNQLKSIDSDYVTYSQIYVDELEVEDIAFNKKRVTVELRRWIEGVTLTKYIEDRLYFGDYEGVSTITDSIIDMSLWLLSSPFAHGDIKADNIIVKDDGTLCLIDWNNCYIPTMNRSPLNEVGTYGYRHPLRDVIYYNNRIDDYPLVVLIVTLMVVVDNHDLYFKYYSGEFAIMSTDDILVGKSDIYEKIIDVYSKNIVLLSFVKLLSSNTPAVEALENWVLALKTLRRSNHAIGDEIFFDQRAMKFGVVDCMGKIVVPTIFDDINILKHNQYGVKFDRKWGVIDTNAMILQPFVYECIGVERCGRISVAKDGKWGFVDTNFNAVTHLKYDLVNDFKENFAVVKRNGKFGYINIEGVEVIEPQYDFALNVKDKIASVRIGTDRREINFKQFL